jgi:SAM-dependent methyltransferase
LGIKEKVLAQNAETDKIISWLCESFPKRSKTKVLDIGCGFGRNLKPIGDAGFKVVGMDLDPESISQLTDEGYKVYRPGELKAEGQFDVIIMAHIIEHFAPAELFNWLNSQLVYLKKDGYLIIATPLYSSHFYDDFDHIKPYHPEGISMVWGSMNKRQVQFHGQAVLEIKRLWYKRTYFRPHHTGVYVLPTGLRPFVSALMIMSAAIFKLTLGLFGYKDSWIGMYQKTGRK